MSILVPIPSHPMLWIVSCAPLSSSKAEDWHQRTEEHRGGGSGVAMNGFTLFTSTGVRTVLPFYSISHQRLSQEPRSWNCFFTAPQWITAARECACPFQRWYKVSERLLGHQLIPFSVEGLWHTLTTHWRFWESALWVCQWSQTNVRHCRVSLKRCVGWKSSVPGGHREGVGCSRTTLANGGVVPFLALVRSPDLSTCKETYLCQDLWMVDSATLICSKWMLVGDGLM